MADNYLQFCVGIDAAPEAIEWSKRYLGSREHYDDCLDNHGDFNFMQEWEEGDTNWGFCVDYDPEDEHNQLIVYSDAYGDLDQAAQFIWKLLGRFRSDEIVCLDYAETCSKSRIGEFGGGSVVISREGVHWQPNWVIQKVEEIKKAREEEAQHDST